MWKKWVIPAIVALVGPWMLLVGIAMADSPCNRDLTCQRGLQCVENACRATDPTSTADFPLWMLRFSFAPKLLIVTCPSLDNMCPEPYDGRYAKYNEPTWAIEQHTEQSPAE